MNAKHCITVCNRLLSEERSAAETYDLALREFGKGGLPPDLSQIHQDHIDAVVILTENVRSMDGTPDLECEVWDSFVHLAHEKAHLPEVGATLKALAAGEEGVRHGYETALADPEVMPGCKSLIESKLLPPAVAHIATLQRLQTAA